MRLVLLLFIIFLGIFFLFERQENFINNSLICIYSEPDTNTIINNSLQKLMTLLPSYYPKDRLQILVNETGVLVNFSTTKFKCDKNQDTQFKHSPFYDNQMSFYPIVPSTNSTMNQIMDYHHDHRVALKEMANLKKILKLEAENFASFTDDCNRIKSFIEQVQLMQMHLKIEKKQRQPTTASPQQLRELHMKKNITRQLNYARSHLDKNLNLFRTKWKIYLNFNKDNSLCSI